MTTVGHRTAEVAVEAAPVVDTAADRAEAVGTVVALVVVGTYLGAVGTVARIVAGAVAFEPAEQQPGHLQECVEQPGVPHSSIVRIHELRPLCNSEN